jgi:hypothetical protein
METDKIAEAACDCGLQIIDEESLLLLLYEIVVLGCEGFPPFIVFDSTVLLLDELRGGLHPDPDVLDLLVAGDFREGLLFLAAFNLYFRKILYLDFRADFRC